MGIVSNFLFYKINGIENGVELISDVATALFPVLLIIQLSIHILSKNSDVFETVKHYIFSLVILTIVSSSYFEITKVGLQIGDDIASMSDSPIVTRWKELKYNLKKQTKEKEVSNIALVFALFEKYGTFDIPEKAGLLIVGVILLFLQVVYTISFYSGFVLAPVIIALGVLSQYRSNIYNVFKTMLYLVLVPVIIGFILYAILQILNFTIVDGFLTGLESLVSFIVLSLVLLSSFKIGQMVVNGSPLSNAGASLASMLSFGVMRGGTDLGIGMMKKGGGSLLKTGMSTMFPVGGQIASSVGGSLFKAGKGISKVATTPVKNAFNNAKTGSKNFMNKKASDVLKNKGVSLYQGDSLMPSQTSSHGKPEKFNYEKSYSENMSKIKGDSSSGFKNIVNEVNPYNHMKATLGAVKDGVSNKVATSSYNLNQRLGLPDLSKYPLSTKDKVILAGNGLVGNRLPSVKVVNNAKNNMRKPKMNHLAKDVLSKKEK